MPKEFAFLGSKLMVYCHIGERKSVSKALVGPLMVLWARARKGKWWENEVYLENRFILADLVLFVLRNL